MADILISHHIYFYAAHRDRAFNTNGNFIGIIGYPYQHFFTAFKNSAFDKKRLEFDRSEFPFRDNEYISYTLYHQ